MALKDYVTSEMLKKAGKKIGRIVYEDVVKPAAQKIVDDSTTPYDNLALAFLDDLVSGLLEDK